MCSLFGVIDFNHSLTKNQLDLTVNTLARVCESRGSDASGIAYNHGGNLRIFKRPKPAHKLRFRVPTGTSVVMGHTRLATQGDQEINRNNHPFGGWVPGHSFSLAHNGVIWNDDELRKELSLPKTNIETDSYVAVQMIENSGKLDFMSLAAMAEKLDGSFTFTLLDDSDAIYFVKGNNPCNIFHFQKSGLFLYASTKELLELAVGKMNFLKSHGKREEIIFGMGNILRIDKTGRSMSEFNTDRLMLREYGLLSDRYTSADILYKPESTESYLDDLKSVAGVFGFSPGEVETMAASGMTPDEIESCFYDGWF